MKIDDNGVVRDMTAEEIAEFEANRIEDVAVSADTALQTMAAEIASSDTNSIAKIRAAAQRFLDATSENMI